MAVKEIERDNFVLGNAQYCVNRDYKAGEDLQRGDIVFNNIGDNVIKLTAPSDAPKVGVVKEDALSGETVELYWSGWTLRESKLNYNGTDSVAAAKLSINLELRKLGLTVEKGAN